MISDKGAVAPPRPGVRLAAGGWRQIDPWHPIRAPWALAKRRLAAGRQIDPSRPCTMDSGIDAYLKNDNELGC